MDRVAWAIVTLLINTGNGLDVCIDWLAMGNTTTPVKEPVPEAQTSQNAEGLGKLFSKTPEVKKKRKCCFTILKLAYVMLSIINILLSIAVIAVTVSAAIAMKIFTSDQSSKLVAMILLAILAALTLSISIYAMVAVLRDQYKPIRAAIALLIVLIIIKATILGVSVPVTNDDEVKLSRSLSESFQLAYGNDPRHVKLWGTIQNDLKCCGVYSSEDYRNPNVPLFFAPDVPVTCCPGYDPDRSELVQERERQTCKARKGYYGVGCRDPMLDVYRATSSMVISVVIVSIIIKVLKSILGIIIVIKCKKKCEKAKSSQPVTEVVVSPKGKASIVIPNSKTKT